MGSSSQLRSARAIRFGDFELDAERGVLLRRGVKMKLQPQPLRVLEYMVSRAPEITTREELRDHVWGDGVHVDLDLSLNYCIRQIRQVLDDSPSAPLYIETLPKQGYRFIGAVERAFGEEPGASVNATSEAEPRGLTPGESIVRSTVAVGIGDGPRESTTVPPATPWAEHFRRRRGYAAGVTGGVAVLGLVLFVSGWGRRGATPGALSTIRSLAVLPLENLSGDPGQEYFAEGMTDELITMLARDSTLRVVSRTTVMQYKGVHRPMQQIARELGVDGVLEGSVARNGDRVHITIQLIEGPSDTHVWAESYDRSLQDVVSLPREAAGTIARRLGSVAVETAPVRAVNPEAHDAYLRGRYLWFRYRNEEAAAYFRKATELEPDYALGWSGLSAYYGQVLSGGEMRPENAREAEVLSAEKAVHLDDSLPEAHVAMTAALLLARWDFAGADREALRAIELGPKTAEAWHLRAKVMGALNRYPESIEMQKRAMEIEPYERPWALGYAYLLARRFDAAVEDAQQRLESVPADANLQTVLAVAYHWKGMEKESVSSLAQVYLLSGDRAGSEGVRRAFGVGGYDAVAAWQLAQMEEKAKKGYVSPVDLAALHGQMGQREQTLACLEEGLRQRSPGLLWMQADPSFDFVHGEERYRAVVRGVGLPPAY